MSRNGGAERGAAPPPPPPPPPQANIPFLSPDNPIQETNQKATRNAQNSAFKWFANEVFPNMVGGPKTVQDIKVDYLNDDKFMRMVCAQVRLVALSARSHSVSTVEQYMGHLHTYIANRFPDCKYIVNEKQSEGRGGNRGDWGKMVKTLTTNITNDRLDSDETQYTQGCPIYRRCLSQICHKMFEDHSAKEIHIERLLLLLTFHGVGRGGEAGFLKWGESHWDHEYEAWEALWGEKKVAGDKYPMVFCGDGEGLWEIDIFHAMGTFAVLEGGLQRTNRSSDNDSFVLPPFARLEGARRITKVIKKYTVAAALLHLTDATSKSLRKTGTTLIEGNRHCKHGDVIARSGHGKGADTVYGYYIIPTTAVSARGMLVLAGYDDPHGKYKAVKFPPEFKSDLLKFQSRLFGKIDFEELLPTKKCHPLLEVMTATLVKYYPIMVKQTLLMHPLLTRMRSAFLSAGISTDSNANSWLIEMGNKIQALWEFNNSFNETDDSDVKEMTKSLHKKIDLLSTTIAGMAERLANVQQSTTIVADATVANIDSLSPGSKRTRRDNNDNNSNNTSATQTASGSKPNIMDEIMRSSQTSLAAQGMAVSTSNFPIERALIQKVNRGTLMKADNLDWPQKEVLQLKRTMAFIEPLITSSELDTLQKTGTATDGGDHTSEEDAAIRTICRNVTGRAMEKLLEEEKRVDLCSENQTVKKSKHQSNVTGFGKRLGKVYNAQKKKDG